jgi:hypothetical protein
MAGSDLSFNVMFLGAYADELGYDLRAEARRLVDARR